MLLQYCKSSFNVAIYNIIQFLLCLTGSDLFFNQSLVNFRLTAHETSDTPILSAILYIDKNIANKVAFKLYISGPYYLSENVYYINYFDSPRLRLQAGKFNGNRSLVFNVSSDMSECSAGMRTFVMVPVNMFTHYHLWVHFILMFLLALMQGKQVRIGTTGIMLNLKEWLTLVRIPILSNVYLCAVQHLVLF